jgi:hypothetical protein
MGLDRWMNANLATQGYCLPDGDARRLRLGLRFPTALCLALVVAALVLQSGPMLAVLVGIGAIAGWTRRHPFDHLWNHGLRHLARAPELPPNPVRRRHAFKLATAWLAGVAALFFAGAPAAATVLGALLVAACSVVTIFNLCIPSEALAWWERRQRARGVVAT